MLKTKGLRTTNGSVASIPFIVQCPCGEILEGLRRPDYQTLNCPSCGSVVFVLGQSPLASPEPVAAPKIAATVTTKSVPRRRRWKSGVRLVKKRFRRRVVRVRRLFSIPTLIVLSVLGIVGTTAYFQWQARHQRAVRERISSDGREGLRLVAEGDVIAADRVLSSILPLISASPSPMPEWKSYVDAARQAKALAEPLSESIGQTLSFVSADPEARRNVLAGKGILIDAVVTRSSDGDWQVDVVPFAVDEPVSIDLAGTHALDALPMSAPTRVLFVARLDSLLKNDRGWSLRFEPGSLALVTLPGILESIGLGGDAELQELVRQQAELVKSFEKD